MKSLIRKEIIHFLGSLTGYVAIVAFLATSSLFLWIFPGGYNIPESGYATLDPFFQLAPWLYLFLIPAITMRLFAEEKRSGCLELLLTRPIRDFRLVLAKYLSAMIIISISLVPTLIYYFSVFQLGMPAGNLDAGSTWGSFSGLFFLASVYVAIGIFCSLLTDSQVVAFILAMVVSFLFFLGFDLTGDSGIPFVLERIARNLSINEHYLSISRGVIDAQDILYFLAMTLLFLFLSTQYLRGASGMVRKGWRKAAVSLAAIVLILWVSEYMRVRIDLTKEKKYSLAPVSKEIIRSLDESVSIEIFLKGKLPPGFIKLQQAIGDKVRDIGRVARVPVKMVLSDPYEAVPPGIRNNFFRDLAEKGIVPTEIRQKTNKGTSTTLIFPGALLTKGEKNLGISFLRNDPGLSHEINLNRSVEGIEYELISAFQKLMVENKPELVFLQGNGESDPDQLSDINRSLSSFYQTRFITPGELLTTDKTPEVIVITDPSIPFSEADKFSIDQSVMRGSRLLCLINPVEVSLDSLSGEFSTLAFPRDLNLDDLLFRYGARINSDLVQDVQCAYLLVSTSGAPDQPRFSPQPWYYSPLLTPSSAHPVGRNLNPLYSDFASSVDTVNDHKKIKATVILSTSLYGRSIRTPAEVSLESIDKPPIRELFNRPHIPVGILLEGKFTSGFKNRILDLPGIPITRILYESPESKIMVFTSGSLISNKIRNIPGGETESLPLGYDRVTGQTFGNREFFLNAIRYLTDDTGIMQLRNTSVKLRLLDKVRLREEGNMWKMINTVIPVTLIILVGILVQFIRKRKAGYIITEKNEDNSGRS
jgi:ABC-2 type transport system permease protein